MIEIEQNDYIALAGRLNEAIGSGDFFNGSVEYDTDRFCAMLTATAIVYRQSMTAPDGTFSRICDLRPVWWEFSACMPDGTPDLNDFSFETLRRYL